MEIKLTHEESEEYFYNALCNGASYIMGHGLEVTNKKADYKDAIESLRLKGKPSSCIEDIWMEILFLGRQLSVIDHEGDGEYNRSITIEDVHDRVQRTPIHDLTNMIDENDDALTADVILQTVFFEDVIFG